jgi:hypothetical protein
MRSDGRVLNKRSTHRIETGNQTARIQTQWRRRCTARSSSPVTPGYAGDGAGHRSDPNLHQILQKIYQSPRFFMRISKVHLVLLKSQQKIKNEAIKFQTQKFQNAFQTKLNQTSKPESLRTQNGVGRCKLLPDLVS